MDGHGLTFHPWLVRALLCADEVMVQMKHCLKCECSKGKKPTVSHGVEETRLRQTWLPVAFVVRRSYIGEGSGNWFGNTKDKSIQSPLF